jgi:hypothetical protein
MSLYKLPIGIRILSRDEYPSRYNVDEINKNRESKSKKILSL